ncbi:DUF4430 domain-containing protein [Anaerorhabdus furcosa]|uniref:DUF4430 domain-containing protein n=1 Tax=Anaerorhabdus furcosa TaxID=118967 RepID=A0A1T4JWY8_9FIRM|nr:DUF4430 domain-containing protein [Anaerorhabdus furcosa]SJZ34659.1 protein of unknown function [Anaerorhabdus furcosa]
MKKKIIIALSIVAVILLAGFGFNQLMPKQEAQIGDKAINITVVDKVNDAELYSGTIHTDAETLGDALAEAEELKMKTEDSTYGRFIVSLCDVEQGPQESGPWWLYESTNNETCKSQGMCLGIDETMIKDGDDFTFNLVDSFN